MTNLTTPLRFIFYSFLLACLPVFLMAQPINNLVKDVVMPAPNAAALGKYGDVPISHFTGVPNINIPLHTVQTGSLSLPITLDYHASGHKVAETASWVGAGWSLNAGGIITRTVLGLKDEHTKGSLYIDYNAPTSNEEITKGQRDGEADVFSFNVAGYSGKFFFDYTSSDNTINTIITVPHQDIKIKCNLSEYIGDLYTFQSFEIVVPNGDKYIFGKHNNNTAYEMANAFVNHSPLADLLPIKSRLARFFKTDVYYVGRLRRLIKYNV
jgi:hypothetical protein